MAKDKNKEKMKNKKADSQTVVEDDSFVQGEAYPNCDGEPCVNVADEAEEGRDKSAPLAEEAAAAEAAQWKDKYLRLSAEFDNYRKRTLREKMDLIAAGGEDVIKSVLVIVDDLDRALLAVENAKDVEALREGVRLIAQKLESTLRSKGVSEIEAIGLPLDTDLHEAVAKVPVEDEAKKGKIIDVVQKGYKLKDKVVRYAKVVVGE
ncbi:nucleotide exchange factor GrpE [Gallalistipes aquisgranensis]|uniref:nucleotide exchange factor GrpE n=1 Tax=Gallalistipes aquisgranensis TaxID=2779358 RepID=UPI001CF87E56|nr:nucleotide exchange factor GrpE [Gallalistipes aquisgranensis]